MSSTEEYQLHIPGETRALALVRMVVTSLAEKAGLPQEDIDKVEVAVDEACTNVLEHAYKTFSPPPAVQLYIQNEPDQFIVDIVDEGPSFDFNARTLPKFPDHWFEGHTRGVGLFLIKKCVDSVKYERLPGERNRLRLIKNIPA